jgi:hypothetical protein
MTNYIHHVPGRLRLKTPSVKRNEQQARLARHHLQSMSGILAADVNTLTGSIVIRYATEQVDATAILNSLEALGLYKPQAVAPRKAVSLNAKRTSSTSFSDKVVSKVIETVVERSAVALIAALI